MKMNNDLATLLLNVLEDVQAELDCPEVAEYTSLALDRKVARAIARLREELEDKDGSE